MSRYFKKLGIVILLLSFFSGSINIHASADSSPSIEFNVQPAQTTIVKPVDKSAEGRLDIRISPQGKVTNANREPIDVVFIFDKSGSMGDGTKLSSAKAAMKKAIDIFGKDPNPKDQFALIPFASDIGVDNPKTDKIEKDNIIDFPLISNNSRDSVKSNLDLIDNTVTNLSANGGTNYTQSFEKANEMLAKSSNKKKFVIFLTDGQPTHSQNVESFAEKETNCRWIIWPIWQKCTGSSGSVEDLAYYEILTASNRGTKYKVASKYRMNGDRKNYIFQEDSGKVDAVEAAVRQHALDRVDTLVNNDIKLYSIGFGTNNDVDMSYLSKLSEKTGVTAQQASESTIQNIFEDISSKVATPSITATIKINISKYKDTIHLADSAAAKIDENDNIIIKKEILFPLNQSSPGPIDISLPLLFDQVGTYIFDNVTLEYKDLNGTPITPKRNPTFTITVNPDAPATFNGSMTLSKEVNELNNLIKTSNSPDKTNYFNVQYNLQPTGLANNKVSGKLTNLEIRQEIPAGVSLVSSGNVTTKTIDGIQYAVLNLTNQEVNYVNGTFSPSSLTGTMKFRVDWAVSDLHMPRATLYFVDNRFINQQQVTTIPASTQSINMRVELKEFPSNAYYGDGAGIVTKVNVGSNFTISETTFPNDYGLKNKPIKEMVFGNDHSSIILTYSDNETATIYLIPDFELIGKDTGKQYHSGDEANEFVDAKLSKLVPGKDVKYYYSINDQQPWVEFNPEDAIPLTKPGDITIKIKAVGGFALENIIEKTIKIQKKIESVSVTPNPIEVEVGKSVEFAVTILPKDATNKDLNMMIGKETIAYFSDTNRIFGLKDGDTELIIKTKDGSNITVTVPIHVKDPYIALKEIKFKKALYEIKVGEKIAVDSLLIFNPEKATKQAITSVTSKMSDKVEVIEQNGKWYIVGKSVGYSTISATAEKQKDGRIPSDSTLFEIKNNEDQSGDNNGDTGNGRW